MCGPHFAKAEQVTSAHNAPIEGAQCCKDSALMRLTYLWLGPSIICRNRLIMICMTKKNI